MEGEFVHPEETMAYTRKIHAEVLEVGVDRKLRVGAASSPHPQIWKPPAEGVCAG